MFLNAISTYEFDLYEIIILLASSRAPYYKYFNSFFESWQFQQAKEQTKLVQFEQITIQKNEKLHPKQEFLDDYNPNQHKNYESKTKREK